MRFPLSLQKTVYEQIIDTWISTRLIMTMTRYRVRIEQLIWFGVPTIWIIIKICSYVDNSLIFDQVVCFQYSFPINWHRFSEDSFSTVSFDFIQIHSFPYKKAVMKLVGVISIVLLSAYCADSLKVTVYGDIAGQSNAPFTMMYMDKVILPAVKGKIQNTTVTFNCNL